MTTIPTSRQTGAGNLFIINSDYVYEEEKLLRQMGRLLTTRTNISLYNRCNGTHSPMLSKRQNDGRDMKL